MNQENESGRKQIHSSYSYSGSQGRPDRFRSKYTNAEALNQLHNVDDIFPQYEIFFNDTKAKNSEPVREILHTRIFNIDQKLETFDEMQSSSEKIHLKFVWIVGLVNLVYNLKF